MSDFIDGGITAPQGFRAAGVHCGIKKSSGVLDLALIAAAAQAIMTTDPFPKACAVQVKTPGGALTVGGMAKGSGMIEPRMATMLGYLTTDARIEPAVLARAMARVIKETFNAITVDGEC